MLCLSRKLGEVIVIGEKIKIVVCEIDRGKVRLGISAPKNVPVDREEVCERLHGKSPHAKCGT